MNFEESERVLNIAEMSPEHSRRLEKIAESLKLEYANFIDDICRRNSQHDLVWATPLVSRNTPGDDTFLKICRIELIKELLSENDYDRVIVQTAEEAGCLKTNKLVKCAESVECSKSAISCIHDRFYSFRRLIRFIHTEFSIRMEAKGSEPDLDEKTVIVVTPVLSTGFEKGEYSDRYFTDIHDYTDRQLVFIPFLNLNGGYELHDFVHLLVGDEKYSFFFYESLLSIPDLGRIIIYRILSRILSHKRYSFRGTDISEIVADSLKKGADSAPSLKGVLFECFIRRLKRRVPRIDNFIVWYEGRPSDVMEVYAIRSFYPNARCVGYEGFPQDEFFLSLYPTDYQIRSGHVPSVVAIPSQKLYENEFRLYSNEAVIEEVPILRTDYEINNQTVSSQKTAFLIVLPGFDDLSAHIIRMVDECMKKTDADCKIYIKNHPYFDKYTVNDYVDETLCFEPQYVSGSLRECLHGVDTVITACTTSVIEVMLAGVYPIIVNTCGMINFTFLPHGFFEGKYSSIFSVEEFIEAMNARILNNAGIETGNGLFLSPSKENMAPLFC